MKKNKIIIVCVLMATLFFSACGKEKAGTGSVDASSLSASKASNKSSVTSIDSEYDIDLTALSSTMVYSEVYNMMYSPKDYIGKSIKMFGKFMVYRNEDGSQYYPAVVIADATSCCAQGIEIDLEGSPKYPDGYPNPEKNITVVGVFETYNENGQIYCRLGQAKVL